MARKARVDMSRTDGSRRPDSGSAQQRPSSSSSTAGPGDSVVRLRRETKGRKGAGVTLVHGVNGTAEEVKALAKWLKSQCGVGGSVKGGLIELQSADRDRIKTLLESRNFVVKIAGG